MSDQTDDALYLNMLKQMGLQPEIVPSDMRETIYKKLGINVPAKAAANKREKSKK